MSLLAFTRIQFCAKKEQGPNPATVCNNAEVQHTRRDLDSMNPTEVLVKVLVCWQTQLRWIEISCGSIFTHQSLPDSAAGRVVAMVPRQQTNDAHPAESIPRLQHKATPRVCIV